MRFSPAVGRDEPPGTPLSAELLLRPTIRHPDLTTVLTPGMQRAIHLTLQRDEHGRPVDALYVHGDAPREESRRVENVIWSSLVGAQGDAPGTLGAIGAGQRSEPLAITQLMLLYHLFDAVR
ncbi:MAG: hypothetical protein WCF33_16055 [Pseudonocardiaceae bacterium]